MELIKAHKHSPNNIQGTKDKNDGEYDLVNLFWVEI